MPSHYLFFRPKDAVKLVDALRPRPRPNTPRRPFNFEMIFEEDKFGPDIAYHIITDGQRQRLREKSSHGNSSNQSRQRPVYLISDMVTARLVDFTNPKLEPVIKTFRADFISPVGKKRFAYASPYDCCTFRDRMAERGEMLEKVKFLDFKIGDPVENAVKSTFATYDLAVVNTGEFQKYSGRGLALLVPPRLIET